MPLAAGALHQQNKMNFNLACCQWFESVSCGDLDLISTFTHNRPWLDAQRGARVWFYSREKMFRHDIGIRSMFHFTNGLYIYYLIYYFERKRFRIQARKINIQAFVSLHWVWDSNVEYINYSILYTVNHIQYMIYRIFILNAQCKEGVAYVNVYLRTPIIKKT